MVRKANQISQGATPVEDDTETEAEGGVPELDRDFEEGVTGEDEDDPETALVQGEHFDDNEMADVDPRTKNFILRKFAELAKLVPGAASLLGVRPAPRKGLVVQRKGMAAYLEKNPSEDTVTLQSFSNGPLGGQHHSKVLHIHGPGKHKGVPRSLAEQLAREHPADFRIVG